MGEVRAELGARIRKLEGDREALTAVVTRLLADGIALKAASGAAAEGGAAAAAGVGAAAGAAAAAAQA